MSAPPRAIQTIGLAKVYGHERASPVEAVRDLDLLAPSGQVFGFLGPNGAGKTNAAMMACGLIRPTPLAVCHAAPGSVLAPSES